MRLEAILFGLFTLAWLVAIGGLAVGWTLDQQFALSVYHLYGLAVFGGWLSGNFYVQRTKKLARAERSRYLLGYLFGPPGLLLLTHALSAQGNLPLAPVYGLGIYVLFFMVPVSFRRMWTPRDR